MRVTTVIAAMATALALLSVCNVVILLQREDSRFRIRSRDADIEDNGELLLFSESQRPPSANFHVGLNRSDSVDAATLEPFTDGLNTCPDSKRPSAADIVWIQSDWQMSTVAGVGDGRRKRPDVIYIYSAYYDDRPAAGPLPSVRVLALSTLRRNVTVYCALWLKSVERPYTVKAIVNAEAGTGYSYDRQNHREYAYICPLPAFDPVPYAVSVSGIEPCPTGYTTMMPVHRTARTIKPPIEFGVCVTAGYGYLAPEVFVEWVEVNLMFGAAEINLYDTWYAENMSNVFDYYKRRGVLNVYNLHHPKHEHNSWFFNKVRNLRIVALNDCQLRNMYRYRYMIVIDTDEIIVPRTTSNYSALIAELDRQRNVPGTPAYTYVFLNIYFLLDFPPDTTHPNHLRTMQYLSRVRPKSYGYAPKSIVDPRQCSVLFNHYCARYLVRPKKPQMKLTYRVPFATASSHHYRRCGKFYAFSCEKLFAEKTADDFMLRYERRVNERVTPVLRELGILTATV